jgi:hypothetical protein
MIAAGAASMGRATATPAHGAHSRWPRAVARLRLAFRSPAPAASGGARWIGCFRPAPPAAVKEAKGKRPEVEKEPARGGGEDVWSAQAEAEVAQGGGFPEHLVVMVNGLVGRWWIRVTVCFWFIALLVSSDATCWHLACSRKISLVVFFFFLQRG